MLAALAAFAASALAQTGKTTAPFNECPAIGSAPTCQILYIFNSNGSITSVVDPNVGPYDGSEDTLIGVLNLSGVTQTSLTISGVGATGLPIFSFDGDGICTYAPFTGSSYCSGTYYQTDPGDYAGPQNTFTNISADQKTGTITFTGGLTNNSYTYFSLEDAFNASTPPPVAQQGLKYYPMTPCRLVDTRTAVGTFGGPIMSANQTRTFPIQSSQTCNVPSVAQAYALNVTVVPSGALSYLTIWDAGVTQPLASTLNSPAGQIVANGAIITAGTPNGAVSVFVTNPTHLIIDINGYFAP